MKKYVEIGIISLLILVLLLMSGCGTTESGGVISWNNTSSVSEEMVMLTGDAPIVLGSLDTHGIEVNVPANAFEVPTEVALMPLEEEVEVDSSVFKPAGGLYRFEIRGDQPRSDVPLEITIKVDEKILQKAQETEGFRAVHYTNEYGWTYVKPLAIDLTAHTLTFETYHNNWWGAAELSEDERTTLQINDISRRQWITSQIDGEMEALTKEIVDEMLIGAFDQHNTDIATMIAKEVTQEIINDLTLTITSDSGSETKVGVGTSIGMMDNVLNGDYAALSTTIAMETGKALSKRLSNESLGEELGTGLKHAGVVAQSLGAISEGDFIGASKHISEFVIGESKVLKAGQLAVKVVDKKISNWRDTEIEKAYQIYLNGTESWLPWGYNVEAGDFESLFTQMRGVAHKVQADALERYAFQRDIHVDDIPADVANDIRNQASKDLEEQFELRKQQESEIEKLRKNNEYVMERIKDWKLMDRGRSYFPDDYPVELQIERIFGQINKVMHDTSRNNVIYDMSYPFELQEDQVELEQILDAIFTRYTDGEEAYWERLKELGLIEDRERYVDRFAFQPDVELTDGNGLVNVLMESNILPFNDALRSLGTITVDQNDQFSASGSHSKSLDFTASNGEQFNWSFEVDNITLEGQFMDNDINEKVHGTGRFSANYTAVLTSHYEGEILGESFTTNREFVFHTTLSGTMDIKSSGAFKDKLFVTMEAESNATSGSLTTRRTSSRGDVSETTDSNYPVSAYIPKTMGSYDETHQFMILR